MILTKIGKLSKRLNLKDKNIYSDLGGGFLIERKIFKRIDSVHQIKKKDEKIWEIQISVTDLPHDRGKIGVLRDNVSKIRRLRWFIGWIM